MINLIKENGEIVFQIGIHRIPVEQADALLLGEVLRHESIEKLAEDCTGVDVGEWKVLGALDEEEERGRDLPRLRILLCHGAKKWHLEQEEAAVLGSLFRTESAR